MSYQPIETYGIIGNLHTVALVGNHDSVDWWCFPRFDFLLDTFSMIAIVSPAASSKKSQPTTESLSND